MVKQTNISFYFILICLVGGFLFAPITQAQDAVTDNQVNDVAKEMYCPVCPNEPLDTCATQACQEWREEIRIMLSDGMSKDEIQDNFYDRYGSKVLAEPKVEGIGYLLWFGIPIGLLAGGFLLFHYMKHLSNSASASTTAAPSSPRPSDDPYLQKLEDELQKRS